MTRSTGRVAAVASLVLLAVTGMTGCGSSAGDSSSSSSSSSATASSPTQSPSAGRSSAPAKRAARITIKNFEYSGDTTVAPGTRVFVTNTDSEAHTVTADSGGAFDLNVPGGKTASFTAPTKPGSYPYHCTYHADMHGKLTVGG